MTTYIKNCSVCNKEFKTNKKSAQFCSRSCIGKARIQKNKLQDIACPICGKMFTPYRRVACSRNCSMKKKYEDPMYKEKMEIHLKDPNRWTHELRARVSESMKAVSHNAKWRENLSQKLLLYNSIEENKIKRADALNYGGRYKWHKFILPSGAVVKTQGYENKAILLLLLSYNEEDIIIGGKAIRKELGNIFYVCNEKKHLYVPDIYIKSLHTIIEVKSEWTFQKNEDINALKMAAVLKSGIKFRYMVFNKKGQLI